MKGNDSSKGKKVKHQDIKFDFDARKIINNLNLLKINSVRNIANKSNNIQNTPYIPNSLSPNHNLDSFISPNLPLITHNNSVEKHNLNNINSNRKVTFSNFININESYNKNKNLLSNFNINIIQHYSF